MIHHPSRFSTCERRTGALAERWLDLGCERGRWGSRCLYKRHINAICRAATPQLVESDRVGRSQKTHQGLVSALGHYIAIGLAMDQKIYRAPVPAALRTQIAPLLANLHRQDALAVHMLSALKAQDRPRLQRTGDQWDALAKKFDRLADALGFRACGSDMTRALDRA